MPEKRDEGLPREATEELLLKDLLREQSSAMVGITATNTELVLMIREMRTDNERDHSLIVRGLGIHNERTEQLSNEVRTLAEQVGKIARLQNEEAERKAAASKAVAAAEAAKLEDRREWSKALREFLAANERMVWLLLLVAMSLVPQCRHVVQPILTAVLQQPAAMIEAVPDPGTPDGLMPSLEPVE